MPFPPRTGSPANTSSPTDRARLALRTCFAALIAAAPLPLAAQDPDAPPSLEELIPDSAVDNPDAWAEQGTDGPATAETDALSELEAETPIAEMPGMTVAWPEEVDLDPLEELAPDEDIQFAELLDEAPQIAFDDAETFELDPSLVLGFPQREPPFSERGDFIDRFEALSTIEELESGDENVALLAARARKDQELLETLLRVYGYYDGEILRTIGSREAGAEVASQRPQVRFDIIPGPRYTYGAIDLGELDTAPDAPALRDSFNIRVGDFLQSDTIMAERFNLDRALGETGYAFAEIDEPELLIDHERVEGDVYKRSLAFDLRRAITATGLVSTVGVEAREVKAPQGDEPGVVEMDVTMERAKVRTISGAIGYGSEEGFRVQASWEHRNFFPPEGALRVRGILGTREQLIGATFRKNNFGGRDKVLTVDAYASSIDTVAYDADTVALTGTYERTSTLLFQKPLAWGVGAEILATDERNRVIGGIPRPRQTYFIASIFGRATIDTSDSLLDPTRGFRISGFLGPETSRTGGEQYYYLRNQVDAAYYQSVGERLVVAGRLRFASIQGADLAGIAPSRRLYSGGGGSVRGYGYQAIGPKNDLLEPTGGRSLVEASLEARIGTGFLDGAVSIVPFVDAGSVSIEAIPDFRFIKFGAGVGVRYATGFGPIRLDVGIPLNPDPDDSAVGVYISLGQAF